MSNSSIVVLDGLALDGRLADLRADLLSIRQTVEALVKSVQQAEAPPRLRMLTATQVAELIGMDIRTLRRLVRQGEFPPPSRLGRSLRWLEPALVERLRQGTDG